MRMRGIEHALREEGISLKEKNIIIGDWKDKETRVQVQEMLKRPDCPQAFIAMNDEMAVAVRDAAFEAGFRIPEDISLSGFDNADIVHYGQPKITTIDRPLHNMGYKSMELLVDQIENGYDGDVNITLPCRIVEGTSIKVMEEKEEQ